MQPKALDSRLCRKVWLQISPLYAGTKAEKAGQADRWVFVCEAVVQGHVFEIWSDVPSIEVLYHIKAEAGINEDCTEIGFNHIR
jgi:hypothetical protein